LSQKRAVVGISREQRDLSVALFEELSRRGGYDVVPVNPKTSEVSERTREIRWDNLEHIPKRQWTGIGCHRQLGMRAILPDPHL
jgi:predicted CoA-binding protein